MTNVNVEDFRVGIQDRVEWGLRKHHELCEKKIRRIASIYEVPLNEVKKSFRQAGYEFELEIELKKETIMYCGSPTYPETIFVINCKQNEVTLQPPFTKIEISTIHEVGHVFANRLSKLNKYEIEDQELIMRQVMASEGFAEILTLDYVVPFLDSKTLSQHAEKHIQDLLSINDAAKGKISKQIFKEKYKEWPFFRNALAYPLFKMINSEFGIDGLKKAIVNLPELKDYLPGNQDYLIRVKTTPS